MENLDNTPVTKCYKCGTDKYLITTKMRVVHTRNRVDVVQRTRVCSICGATIVTEERAVAKRAPRSPKAS